MSHDRDGRQVGTSAARDPDEYRDARQVGTSAARDPDE
jgi:hypothetical protein